MIAELLSSRNTVPALFDGVEITSDTLTGRRGLALFSRYLRNVVWRSPPLPMVVFARFRLHMRRLKRCVAS